MSLSYAIMTVLWMTRGNRKFSSENGSPVWSVSLWSSAKGNEVGSGKGMSRSTMSIKLSDDYQKYPAPFGLVRTATTISLFQHCKSAKY